MFQVLKLAVLSIGAGHGSEEPVPPDRGLPEGAARQGAWLPTSRSSCSAAALDRFAVLPTVTLCAAQLMIPRGTPEGKLLRKAGIMSIVERGGPVAPDDPITVTLPPEPHQRLAVV